MTGLEAVGLLLVAAVVYGGYAIWHERREALRDYTHMPNRTLDGFVRVLSDAEGRAAMEADRRA